MNITLNGELLDITSHTLLEILKEYGAVAPYAVAVNCIFIPKSQHNGFVINEGDSIELLSPIQGG
tara:strand:+ start:473 stop:667 length:195 start_codon:yes stop_codon:yes gene_type:complete